MAYDYEKEIAPRFVRTKHLPLEPNAQRDDLIAHADEASVVYFPNGLAYEPGTLSITVEEKVDGANCGVTFNRVTGEPILRNRSHILAKGYGRKETPAKKQFAAIWNWWYENEYKVKELSKLLGFVPTIYGEWLYARHTISYDRLPDYFVAFDVYRPEDACFLAPKIYRTALEEVGISVVPLVAQSNNGFSPSELIEFRNQPSPFSSTETREGIYLKVDDGQRIINRFKMVRPNFITDNDWNDKELIKNKLRRK